jgi:alkylmercury lyase
MEDAPPYRRNRMDMISAEALQRARQQRRQLSEVQERVLREAFHLIRVGRVATVVALEARTGLSSAEVHAALGELPAEGRLVYEADAGGIVGAFGLSLLPTPHLLVLDGRQLFAWCALDATGIPVGLAMDATVRSQCCTCQQEVNIAYSAGIVMQARPTALCLWVAKPEVGQSVVGDT